MSCTQVLNVILFKMQCANSISSQNIANQLYNIHKNTVFNVVLKLQITFKKKVGQGSCDSTT